jgi:hypothetical protein
MLFASFLSFFAPSVSRSISRWSATYFAMSDLLSPPRGEVDGVRPELDDVGEPGEEREVGEGVARGGGEERRTPECQILEDGTNDLPSG